MRSNTSFSQIQNFRNCPRSWFVKTVLGETTPQGDSAKRGEQFDQMVAFRLGLHRPKVNAEPIDKQPLADRVMEAVDVYMNHPRGWKDATDAQRAIELKPNQWDVLAQEYGVEFTLDLPLIGYIDLFKESGVSREVVDLKTSDRKDFKPDWGLQGTIYCLVERAQRFEVHLVTFTKQIALHTYSYRPTAATFRWAMQIIGSTHQQMKRVETLKTSEEVEATPGFYCAWCPRELSCEGAMVGRLKAVEV